MNILQRYFAIEITRAVALTLMALLMLFASNDLMRELQSVGRGGYQLHHAFLYVILGLPGYVYELMPLAALIGTILALAQFAAHSEFTIMRVSSMSTVMAGWMLMKIGLVFVLVAFLFGEFISPISTDMGEKLKSRAQGVAVSKEFGSGHWAKDVIHEDGVHGAAVGTRFLNVWEIIPSAAQLNGVKLYEFDRDMHLAHLITASRADYQKNNIWRLSNVTDTRFTSTAVGQQTTKPDDIEMDVSIQGLSTAVSTTSEASRDFFSENTPEILSIAFADPDRMSAYELAAYTKHLGENKQQTERYEIAFWKKIINPFAILVMMALALPFAYLHFRTGGVSIKIFGGVMLGATFLLVNLLFSHLGLLNTWPPLATALLPSVMFLLLAISGLWWVERN